MNPTELQHHEDTILKLKQVQADLINLQSDVPAAIKVMTLDLDDYIHKYEHWLLSFKMANDTSQIAQQAQE